MPARPRRTRSSCARRRGGSDRGVTLKYGCVATEIDVGRRELKIENDESIVFSKLILATGSPPLRLNVPGADLAGVHTFRDSRDVDLLLTLAAQKKRVVVVGGGLLGLEAAYGLAKAGAPVTLIHLMDRLMERQLDAPAAELLKSLVERKGIKVLLNANTARIHGESRVEGLELADGRRINADAVIFAAGIRPNTALAKEAGMSVNRGIVVDDHLQTAASDVFAIGECAEHRGICYGLVEPAYEQARVLAQHLAGSNVSYAGSVVSTNLKVSGVSVFSAGDFIGADGSEQIVLSDVRHGTYKKLVISEGRAHRRGAGRRYRRCALVSRTDPQPYTDRAHSRRHDVRPCARACRRGGMSRLRHDRRRSRLPRYQHHLSLLRGRLRRARDAGRQRRRGDRRVIPTIPPISAGFAQRARRSARRSGSRSRLLYPMIRCSKGTMERVAWSDALDHVAHRLQHIIARDGPGAVAFYLSGQLLTEDYYVANKLMKGFIGSANVDTNSRLCMASSVAGHRRAFGADTVPGCYEDLDEADLLVFVGSNAAWCHPVLFQRMLANKQKRGARMVVIDPRRTDTAGDADLFLGLKPGTDTALFCGATGASRRARRARPRFHRRGTPQDLTKRWRVRKGIAGSVAATALATGLTEQDVAAFFRMFAETPRVVTLYSQGVNQSAQGTDKVNAIINCHLATGRIGKVGASPFSLTGQPNAMGGREVGGLANQLAAHMAFTPPDIDRVRRFWKAPHIATHEGLKAVQMFEAIGRGEIKALWVMGTNPAVSLPDADAVRAAMKKLELLRHLGERALQRHRQCRRACAAAGAGLGRKIRHRDQFGAPHLPPARLPRCAGRSEAGLVDRRRGRQSASALVRHSISHPPPISFASTPRSRPSRTTAAAISIIGALTEVSDEAFDTLAPVQWPVARGRSAAGAVLRRRRLLRRRSAWRASSRRKCPRCAARPARRGRCGSTPAASGTNGTP